MKISIKEVFESENWIITKVMRGHHGKVRIDAKRRNPVADKSSFFCEWCTETYADKLCKENYNKHIVDLRCYSY